MLQIINTEVVKSLLLRRLSLSFKVFLFELLVFLRGFTGEGENLEFNP